MIEYDASQRPNDVKDMLEAQLPGLRVEMDQEGTATLRKDNNAYVEFISRDNEDGEPTQYVRYGHDCGLSGAVYLVYREFPQPFGFKGWGIVVDVDAETGEPVSAIEVTHCPACGEFLVEPAAEPA